MTFFDIIYITYICVFDSFISGRSIFSALSALWQMQISPILRTMEGRARHGRWRNTYLIRMLAFSIVYFVHDLSLVLLKVSEIWNSIHVKRYIYFPHSIHVKMYIYFPHFQQHHYPPHFNIIYDIKVRGIMMLLKVWKMSNGTREGLESSQHCWQSVKSWGMLTISEFYKVSTGCSDLFWILR